MKKRISFAIIVIAIFMFAISAVGCAKKIGAPTGVTVDQDYNLTWNAVRDARSYSIKIINEDTNDEIFASTRKRNYSLARLAEGTYSVSLRAIAGYESDKDSSWTKAFTFVKPYEPGCTFTLVNNGAEYELTRAGSAEGDVVIGDTFRGKPVTSIAKDAFKANGNITSIVIGNNVKTIGDRAFYNCTTLTSITFPENLQSLGKAVFQGCRALTSVAIPDSITTIPDSTFAYCRSLTEVKIGSNIQSIGEYAFNTCTALTSVTIPDSVQVIGQHSFSDCEMLKSVNIGKGVLSIGAYAFNQSKVLETLTFAEGSELLVINERAFANSPKLNNVVLPEGLIGFGDFVFYNCTALESINIPTTVTQVGQGIFNATKIISLQANVAQAEIDRFSLDVRNVLGIEPDDTSVNMTLILQNLATYMSETEYTNLVKTLNTDVLVYYHDNWVIGTNALLAYFMQNLYATTPESNTSAANDPYTVLKDGTIGICNFAFYGSYKLQTAELPVSVKYLGAAGFAVCQSLWKVTIPNNSVKTIGVQAFASCSTLQNLSIGEGVEVIEDYAFINCGRIVEIENRKLIPDSVTRVGAYAFKGTGLYSNPINGVVYAGSWAVGFQEGVNTTVLRKGTIGIADYAFNNCDSLRNITGSAMSEVKYIGMAAFRNCVALATIALGDNIKRIENFTFYNCISLFRFEAPIGLEYIGQSAFFNCATLSELDFSKTELSYIGKFAFYKNINIKEIKFNDKLESISERAFYGCAALTELVIPDSVKSIGVRAFYGAKEMTSLKLGASVEVIGESAFSKCEKITSLIIPGSVKSVGRYAFYKCTGVKELIIENGVEEIDDFAFYGFENVKELVIPDSVEKVGKYAFKGYKAMTSLTINGTIAEVAAHAFYGCKQATIYTNLTAEDMEGWNIRWNSSNRPVVMGCTLSADGTYVESVAITETALANVNFALDENGQPKGSVAAPSRAGYVFKGWATTSGATVAEYDASEITSVPVGITLYAVWEVAPQDSDSEQEPQA